MKHCLIHPAEYYEDTCPQCQPESKPPLAGSGGSVVATLTCTRCGKEYRTEEPLVTLRGKQYPRKLCYKCVVMVAVGFVASV